MGRAPKNTVIDSLYTNGGEFYFQNFFKDGVYEEYIGDFYVVNGIAYAGKDPNDTSTYLAINKQELILLPQEEEDNLLNLAFPRIKKLSDTLKRIQKTTQYARNVVDYTKRASDSIKNTKETYFPRKTVQQRGEGTPALTGIHYYVSKRLDPRNIITEIDLSTYNSYVNNGLVRIAQINFDLPDVTKQIEEAEKQIPGIKVFLGVS